jgi:UDP-2-acetamido-3-amino-2,3-dideoxy-glucuronate N-acetyltransferase
VHPSAVIDPGAVIGAGTRIWHFCHVMGTARIGERCSLGQGCFVGERVHIGSGVRIQNHVSVFEGVELEDDVFVGPSVVFTNVKNPRAHVSRRHAYQRIRIRRGATLGANATLLPGVEVGRHALVGAGATVTASVAPHVVVTGVPPRPAGVVSRHGERLEFVRGRATCPVTGERYRLAAGGLVQLESVAE